MPKAIFRIPLEANEKLQSVADNLTNGDTSRILIYRNCTPEGSDYAKFMRDPETPFYEAGDVVIIGGWGDSQGLPYVISYLRESVEPNKHEYEVFEYGKPDGAL